MTLLKRAGKGLLALVFWLCLWAALAAAVGRELLLPGPLAVLRRLGQLAVTGGFWQTVAVSLGRILAGAVCGIALGVLLAALTCRFSLAKTLLSPLLSIAKATPVASFVLLLLIWLGRDILPSVIVVIMAAPVVWAGVAAGIENTDPAFLELGRAYGFGPGRRLRRIYAPSVKPYFLSACETALGLSWKAGVAAEVLAVPRLSIGRNLYESKLYLETADLFAWTVVVVLCSIALEKLFAALCGRGKGGGHG